MITGRGAQPHGIIIAAFNESDNPYSSYILFITEENPEVQII
jgi:hypothetical protein